MAIRCPGRNPARAGSTASAAGMCCHPLGAAPPGALKVPCEVGEGSLDELAPRDHDPVDARTLVCGEVMPEHLANQTLRPVTDDCSAEFPRRHDPKSGRRAAVGSQQKRQIAALNFDAGLEDLLKLSTTPHPVFTWKALSPGGPSRAASRSSGAFVRRRHVNQTPERDDRGCRANPYIIRPRPACQDEETVRRLRPLARRRFRTRRPFFVAMRTRKPCVRRRRLVLGWNVRLPFAMIVGTPATLE